VGALAGGWCGRHGAPLRVSDAGGEGKALEPGVWNIPVPSHGPIVTPDIVIAPVVGLSIEPCYRPGATGGGFFRSDARRLLAAAHASSVWGYARQEIGTIYPQAHDVSDGP